MQYVINSRKLNRYVTFWSSLNDRYIFVDLNGQPGVSGNQLCVGGQLSGSTITAHDAIDFRRKCKNWFKQYLRKMED